MEGEKMKKVVVPRVANIYLEIRSLARGFINIDRVVEGENIFVWCGYYVKEEVQNSQRQNGRITRLEGRDRGRYLMTIPCGLPSLSVRPCAPGRVTGIGPSHGSGKVGDPHCRVPDRHHQSR